MINAIRRRLFWKILLACLSIVGVAVGALLVIAPLTINQSFANHLDEMSAAVANGIQETPQVITVPGMGPGGMWHSQDSGQNQGTTQAQGPRWRMGWMMQNSLFTTFRQSATEAIWVATLAALAAALAISVFISRRMVKPILRMTTAARRIAEGHYNERVQTPTKRREDDLDELGQMAYSFNLMAASLERTEDMRRQLIGDVAHELRTPLTTIKGSMEGLMDGVLPANSHTYQQVFREAERLEKLVAGLQELSRVEGGAFTLDLRLHTPEHLIDTLVERIGTQYAEKGIILEKALASNLPALNCDEDRTGQVLLNLAGNALHYTPAGGKVTVSAVQKDKEIIFSVTDNGSGIPAEHLPHVFDRFYRVDKSRSRASGGSGIGLTIAKRMVEAHGGRIWVESEGEGKGCKFSFALQA